MLKSETQTKRALGKRRRQKKNLPAAKEREVLKGRGEREGKRETSGKHQKKDSLVTNLAFARGEKLLAV